MSVILQVTYERKIPMYFQLQTYQVYSMDTASAQNDALLGYFILREIAELT
jgi:hypothetical protein